MQSPKRNIFEVAVHWAAGPVIDTRATSVVPITDRVPAGELRSYLRDLALGRR